MRCLKKGGNNFLDIGGWNYLAYTAQSLNPMNFNVGTTAAVADAVSLSHSFRNGAKILMKCNKIFFHLPILPELFEIYEPTFALKVTSQSKKNISLHLNFIKNDMDLSSANLMDIYNFFLFSA